MKAALLIKRGFFIGTLYTFIFMMIGIFEQSHVGSNIKIQKTVIAFLLISGAHSIATIFVLYIYNIHKNSFNKGWQRILTVFTSIFSPTLVLIYLKIESFDSFAEYLEVAAAGLCITYILSILLSVLSKRTYHWIKEGFTEEKPII